MACRVVTEGGATKVKTYIPFDESKNGSIELNKNYLFMTGGPCPVKMHRESKVFINFHCGTHLGSPQYLLEWFCQVGFRWRTSAACKEKHPNDDGVKAPVQVPCYVVDEATGVKYDLSHLTRTTGYHEVEASKMDLFINVCQEINDPMIRCAPGTAACLNLQKTWKAVGVIRSNTKVELVEGTKDLIITYPGPISAKPFHNCDDSPSTVIHFRCPSKRGRPGKPPRLLANISCQYMIEWETDHACPEHAVLGDAHECKLNVDGNPIELGRLRNPKDNGYHRVQNVTIDGVPREVVIDICNMGIGNEGPCGEMGALHSANVCFKDDKGQAVVLGTKADARLRYTDGRAVLVYPDGGLCKEQSNRKWSTVIEFVCDSDSAFGEPVLTEVNKDLCLVQFEWRTVSSCVPDVVIPDSEDYSDFQETCIHVESNFTVDLISLSQSTGPWHVMDEDKRFPYPLLLNVCSPVRSPGLAANCSHDSSICGIGENAQTISYGKFSTMKLSQTHARPVAMLEFSAGDKCATDASLNYRTKVHMVCIPGAVGISPRFIALDEKECVLHLEWHTRAACPQVSLVSSGCMVESKTHGFKIDLTPLKELGVQTIQHEGYEYDISVCAPLSVNYKCVNETSICRRKLDNKHELTPLGEPSSVLTYNGGLAVIQYHGVNESSSITFTCDYNAQAGKPVVFAAQQGLTAIEWATSFACPTTNAHYQSCLVFSKDSSNHLYDLSRLSRVKGGKDWIVESQDPKDPTIRLRFHVNLCQPLKQPPKGCDPTASICVETIYPDRKPTVADAGHAVNPPIFERGQLMLNYSNGEPCLRRGVNSTRRTVIHFQCGDHFGGNGEYLQFIGRLDECGYSLLWTTEAACPIRHQTVKDECTVVDRLTGDAFNVSHMIAPTFYTAENYQFNLCGPIRNSSECPGNNVSVCLIDKDGKGTAIATSSGYQLDFIGVDGLRLSYMGDVAGNTTRVEIELVCTSAESSKEGSSEVLGPVGGDRVHRIIFYSSGLCVSQRSDQTSCEIINRDTGQVYDLRPLTKMSLFNWEAEEYTSINQGYTQSRDAESRYYFNICRKLNPMGNHGDNLPKDSFASVTHPGTPPTMGLSLGRHIEEIGFTKDGTILIKYVGGDPCPQTDSNKTGISKARLKSSLITLACSPSDEEMPKILRNSDNCDYIFYMETPAACPVRKVIGGECRVWDPNFKHEYDISPLGAQGRTYSVMYPHHLGTFRISVCQALRGAAELCGGDDEAAACLVGEDGRNVSLGKASSKLQYDTGILTLVYKDGAAGCASSGEKRSTTIHFLCDHSAKVGISSPLFGSVDENCGHVFHWYTELACPPREEVQCKIETPHGLVDLSKLSNPRGNYIVNDAVTQESIKYVINICRSVIPKKSVSCDFRAGACSVSGNKTINLGVASKPFYNDEEMSVKASFLNGDPCPEGGKDAKWSTSITFGCTENEDSLVHFSTQGCTVYFMWRTRDACPMSSETKPVENRTCTTIHPASNQTIDLQSLVRADTVSPYRIRGPNGSEFKLNICGKARQTSCGEDTGICLEKKNESAHKVAPPSTKLIWDDGVLAMVFTGGDRCGLLTGDREQNMSAIIHFVCPSAGYGTEAPTFVSQSRDDCEHRFVWPTELVCHQVLQCVHYEEGETYDLSALSSRAHSVHNIIDPGYQYFISVCRPLEPIRPYTSMHPNAAAVRVAVNTKHVESLGHVLLEPFTDFQNAITLIYINGSQCEYDEKQLNKARIIFECDYSQDAGEPVLIDIDKDECIYLFRWRTNLVCPGAGDLAIIDPRREKCKFEIPQRGLTIDLTALSRKSPYQIKANGPDGKESGTYSMSLCKDNPTSGCRNSELCFSSQHENISYGVADSFFFQRQSLFVRFDNGSPCVGATKKTHAALVQFECDPFYETGGPVIEKQFTCTTVFRWKTAHVCTKQQLQEHSSHECIISDRSKSYDLTMLSSVSHVWILNEPESRSQYYLNVCGIGYNWPLEALDKCSHTGVCVNRMGDNKKSDYSSLGDYLSRQMEVVRDDHIRITYRGGDPSNCHRLDEHPTTVIDLICAQDGDLIGTPTLVQEPTSTNCSFVFRWFTRSACAETTDELVLQKNGFLVDARLHRAFNLTSLFNTTYRVQERRNQNDNYTYLIHLGEVTVGGSRAVPWRMGPCAQSAVCQSKKNYFMKNLGTVTKQKFLLRGRELLLEIDTGALCLDKANETVKSIFSFTCDSERTQKSHEPVFVYETRSCHYIFSWPTEFVCADKFVSMYVIDNQVGGGASSAAGVVTTLTILGVIVAGVMIFFSKPENRMAVRSRTLRFFRTVTMPHYYYSKTESEMQSPLDNDGDTVLLSPSLVLQPEDEDYTPLA
ncbi:cation-independent mannose-6-phosphate receptor [Galendromus occidentalis]|uniref:Cation-independent mannose-6-phosphate receptor n=1 Tax=Galendromus occidentalis TaxID=34638 RepID=A0AAJ6W021_9ACAR|nr:cation-independent mannose-6-phosphate receptor [Galendromus occidentalis]